MHNITLDFSNPGLPQVIDVMQSDAQSRFIGLTLYDGGVPYSAPSGAQYTVQYRGSGANNMGWYDTIQLSSGTRKAVVVSSSSPNVVTLELAEQALRVNGKVEVSLCVVNNTGYKLNTFPIICRVTGAPYVDPVAVRSYFYVTGITSEQWLAYVTACQDAQKRAEDAAATFETDPTLSVEGKAADAKATEIACNLSASNIYWNPNNVNLSSPASLNSYFGCFDIIAQNSIIDSITFSGTINRGTMSIYIVDEELNVLKTVKITSNGTANQTFTLNYIPSANCKIIIGTETSSFNYSSSGGTGNLVEYKKSGNTFLIQNALKNFSLGVVTNIRTNVALNKLTELSNLLFASNIYWNANNVNLSSPASLNSYFGYSDIIAQNSIIDSITFSGTINRGTMSIYIVDEELNVLKTVKITSNGTANQTFTLNYIPSANCKIIIGTETSSFNYSSSGGTGNLVEYKKSGNTFLIQNALKNFSLGVIITGSFEKLSNNNTIVVSKASDSKIKTIDAGVALAKKRYAQTKTPQVVSVFPGTYEEHIVMGSSDGVSIVGTDRNQCVIIDNSGEYNNAPLRVSGNAYIANLTLIATHKKAINYITAKNLNVNPSYALHIDDRHADDNNTYRCTIENCILISEQNPAVGIGLDKNQVIELINCECLRQQTNDLDNITSVSSGVFAWKPNGGAIFYHAQYPYYTDDSGTQTLRIKNCLIENNKDNVIAGERGSSLDKNVVLELIGNSGYAGNGLTWDKNLENAVISPLSYGNNVQSMNYRN